MVRRSVFSLVLLATSLQLGQFQASDDGPQLSQCYNEYDRQLFQDKRCPSACPLFMDCRGYPVNRWACIKEEQCSQFVKRGVVTTNTSTNDTQTRTCVPCAVEGCLVCPNITTCTQCDRDYELSEDGSCWWTKTNYCYYIMGAVGVLAAWLAFDLGRACSSKRTNYAALSAGLRARYRCLVRQLWLEDCPLYPLTARMHTHRDGHEPVCGAGVSAFMNWLLFIVVVGLWLFVGALIFAPYRSTAQELQSICGHLVPLNGTDVENGQDLAFNLKHYRSRLSWSIWNYVGVSALTVVFFFLQQKLMTQMRRDGEGIGASLPSYACCLDGFPPDATDNAKVAEFVREEMALHSLPPDKLVHVSIAYSYPRKLQPLVDRALDGHLRRVKHRRERESAKAIEHEAPEIQETNTESDDDVDWTDVGAESDPGPFWIRLLGFVFLGLPFECGSVSSDNITDYVLAKGEEAAALAKLAGQEDLRLLSLDHDLLNQFTASGTVYAVFETEVMAVAMRAARTFQKEWKDEDGKSYKVKVNRRMDHPSNIRWKDFFEDNPYQLGQRIARGAMVLGALQAVWFVIYGLYFDFAISSSASKSNATAFVDSVVLGGLIGVSNCCIAYAVQIVTNHIGFRHQGHALLCQLLLTVLTVGMNCLVDLHITLQLSMLRGSNKNWLGRVFSDFKDIFVPFDKKDPLSIVSRMDFQAQFTALMPSYVLVPYLAEPLGTIILPLVVGIYRIQRDNRVDEEAGERLLLPPEIELVNPALNDIICSSSVMFYSFWLMPGEYHKQIFGYYLFYGIFVYLQQRYRILRLHSFTYYDSRLIFKAESFLWSVPVGILAAALYRELGGGFYGFLGFLSHVLAQCVFVQFVLPQFIPELDAVTTSYSSVIENKRSAASNNALANYRNVNPIEVLLMERIALRKGQEPPLVYFSTGEQYLQPGSHLYLNTSSEHRFEKASLHPCRALFQGGAARHHLLQAKVTNLRSRTISQYAGINTLEGVFGMGEHDDESDAASDSTGWSARE
eukprot:TRINITY_DN32845_c0_g2_i1.p1 TRINITY_DN32845_c0_g2~~TRINITY_DN32845_c0_g2_i1.p1  ORF type:complete len:1015 (-),score=191.99 TRINITY_DN32845_c0_g2_i1:302-3346(-)